MNLTKTMFALAMGGAGLISATSAQAANLVNGDILTINPGRIDYYYQNSTSGSYFFIDSNRNSIADTHELRSLSQGLTGITTGTPIPGGNFHLGYPVPTDANSGAIFDSWYFPNMVAGTGTNYTTSPITGGTAGGLTFGGWGMSWADIPAIPLGTGSWFIQPDTGTTLADGTIRYYGITNLPSSGYSNGIARFDWDGVYGSAYSLTYTATLPAGVGYGLGGMPYGLHLEGTVIAVPEASTYGMMLAGLSLVGFLVRRRKVFS